MLAGIIVWLMAAPVSGAADEDGGADRSSGRARETVKALHASLIASMKAGEQAGAEGRFELLNPTIRSAFDMPVIAQLVLGPHWSSLDASQRSRFTRLFRRLTTARYASEFDNYRDQRFELRSVREQRPTIRLVRCVFINHEGRERQFDYQLRRSDEHWRIVNVAVDGVSDMAMKRAQYVDMIDQKGFEALIGRLTQQLRELKASETEDE